MMKSPIMWIIGSVTWLVTALASINIGLEAFNMAFMTTMWMDYIILFSGIFSLGLMIMTFAAGCNCGMCKRCKDVSKSDCKDMNKSNCNSGNSGKPGNMGGNNSDGQRMCACGKNMGQCRCGK